jgi:hypothetical protein
MLLFVVLDICRWTLMIFLRPGHSHEDIDQTFGQVSGHMARHEFSSVDDIVSLLDIATRPAAKSDQLRTQSLSDKCIRRQSLAYKLDETADWKLWVSHLGIKFKGIRI